MNQISKNLKVVILTNYVPPYRIPLYELLYNLFPCLNIFTSTGHHPNPEWKGQKTKFPVIALRTLSLRWQRRHPSGFNDLRRIHIPFNVLPRLRRLKPDVVISAEFGARTLQACMYRKLHPRSRLIIWGTLSEITELDISLARRLLRRFVVRYGDAFITNGESGVRYFESLGVAKQKIHTIPYASDVLQFKGSSTRPAHVASKLLFVGLLIARKGLAPFLKVLRKWANANPGRPVDILIVGDGPEKTELERISATMPASVTIEFRTFVSYQEMPDVYRSCGILAFPTLADEWGLVVNEAMSAGLPVLGSRNSQAVEELVVDDATGWLFQPDDPSSTFDAIDRAVNADARKLNKMRKAALAKIADINPEAMAERTRSVIMGVCDTIPEP